MISSEGGLAENYAKEMGMKPNLLSRRSLAEAPGGIEKSATAGVDEATSANMRNWMECVRSRKTPNASIEAGYSHSIALCMTIAAMHTGQRVGFDDAKQELIVGAPASPKT